MQDPPAGYRDKNRADFDIEKLQGQTKDALGNITFLNAVPPDELLSLKFVIAQYFSGGEGGKTKTRNSEVDVSIPIAHAAKPTNVDYTLRFQPNNDVEVERVGIPDSKELLKATGMNISRVDGFPAKSTPGSFSSWVKTRYPSVKITGTKLTDMQDSVNKDMAANAGTTPWFFDNYGITVLDAGAAASRLTSVHKRVHNKKVDQTADLTSFKPEELKSLEFALETMSADELKLLRDVRFARQKVALDLKAGAIKPDPSAGGETFQDSGERTIVIYDNVTVNDNILFQGGKRGVRQKSVEAYTHELGTPWEARIIWKRPSKPSSRARGSSRSLRTPRPTSRMNRSPRPSPTTRPIPSGCRTICPICITGSTTSRRTGVRRQRHLLFPELRGNA